MGTRFVLALGAMFLLSSGVAQAGHESPASSALDAKPAYPTEQLQAVEAHQKGWDADQRKDYLAALRWYRIAANAGLAKAQYNIGVHYGLGQGVPKNYVEAARWYRMAAEQGFAPAQFNLGVLFESGAGTPVDVALARFWYQRAAAQGDSGAIKALTELSVDRQPVVIREPSVHPQPSRADAEAAVRESGQDKPLPGLPDLRRPVFIAANALVCNSPNGLVNSNVMLMLMARTCIATDRAIQVSVLRPSDSEQDFQSRMFRIIRVIARPAAMSDASVAIGWVRIEDLRTEAGAGHSMSGSAPLYTKSVQEQTKQLENKVAEDVIKAMEQGTTAHEVGRREPSPVPVASGPTSDVTMLTETEFDAQFQCPETYSTDEDSMRGLGESAGWFKAHHSTFNEEEFKAFRLKLLKAHFCDKTLASLAASNDGRGKIAARETSRGEQNAVQVKEGALDADKSIAPLRAAEPAAGSGAVLEDGASKSDKALVYCLMPKAQYGQYSSYDGGKSAAAILMECPTEWLAWLRQCETSGHTKKSCILRGGIIAQISIRSFNK